MTRAILMALATSLAVTQPPPASAEVVQLEVGGTLSRASLLRAGTQRYLRYYIKDGHRNAVDLWTRVVSFEDRDGRHLVRVRQQWDGVGPTPSLRIEDSLMVAGTMVPITHLRTRTTAGETRTDAFRFDGRTVSGDRRVPGNASAAYSVTAERPVYNFVVDLEWFRQLPMANGRTFAATLFDPPNGEPGVFRFTITGSDRIRSADGRLIDCWVMSTDYNRPERPPARFWFAKSTQIMIRQESDAGDRGILVKILIPNESGD